MRRALRLAILGREAAPNPMVGCVIVDRSGRKVGEGFHVRPGEPHAEVIALRAAGASSRGSTVYVTLEPCSHYGRTPPCSIALVDAGVARIVVAMVDPDQRVSGRGLEALRNARVTVEVGMCDEAARAINAAYVHHRTTGLPFVTVKVAMTLDGKTATVTGDSRWITSSITRKWVHRQLRARTQAIIVGLGTVVADNPRLDVRLSNRPNVRQPYRIVVDSHLATPIESLLVQSAMDGRTLIAYVDDQQGRASSFETTGVKLLRCALNSENRVDLADLMRMLGNDLGVTSVLVEGGAELNAAFISSGLVRRYICTIGAKIVGGKMAPGVIGGDGLANLMSHAVQTTGLRVRRSGIDVVLDCNIRPMV